MNSGLVVVDASVLARLRAVLGEVSCTTARPFSQRSGA
jgi:hypothetical protein